MKEERKKELKKDKYGMMPNMLIMLTMLNMLLTLTALLVML